MKPPKTPDRRNQIRGHIIQLTTSAKDEACRILADSPIETPPDVPPEAVALFLVLSGVTRTAFNGGMKIDQIVYELHMAAVRLRHGE